MSTAEITYRPFSNGSQAADWFGSNCDRCVKSGDAGEAGSSACTIFEAIHDAASEDGTVSPEMAERMGLIENKGKYVWMCNEVEWSQEWMEQSRKKAMIQEITPDERAAMAAKNDPDIERLLVLYDYLCKKLSTRNTVISELKEIISIACDELEEYGVLKYNTMVCDDTDHPLFSTWLALQLA